MVARRHPPTPRSLVITFERFGSDTIRIEVEDGEKAMIRAVALLLAHRELRGSDCLTVHFGDLIDDDADR